MAKNKPVSCDIMTINYFGLKMDKVKEFYEGNPEYIGEVIVKNPSGTLATVAAFKVAAPNRDKGHKDFLLIQLTSGGQGIVAGMDKAQFAVHSEHGGVKCLECEKVIYSVARHDFHKCGCPNEAMVDGGKDYMRYGAVDMSKIEIGVVDIMNRTFCRTVRPTRPEQKPVRKKVRKSASRS